MSYNNLDHLNQTLHALSHAMAILGADEATNMPTGGGEERANSLSALTAMHHEKASAPHIADWIEKAENSKLDTDQKHALAEFKRLYEQRTCLPAEFVGAKTKSAMKCEQLWRELRPKGDWKSFAPALGEVISFAREEAQMRSHNTGLEPYDAMIDQYDPGNKMADIDPVFAELKVFLKSFVPEALEIQKQRLADRPLKPLNAPFPVEKQRSLGQSIMKQMGFDFNNGRLDTSHHPFCGGVPTDVRMTTRYQTDTFLPGLMGILHETGHAQYEQGLPRDNAHWPHNQARGMGMHESQSLFVEMQIVRSPMFWKWVIPLISEHLGSHVFENWEIEDVLAHVNLIERGFIRVDADEVTYPLHVILRYELEQDLIGQKIEVHHIPEAWNAKMEEYLGLSTLENMSDGPMQDVHWPAGLFGYFPSYTLGALMAAQQWASLVKQIPTAPSQIEQGNFNEINAWRAKNVWQKGSRFSTTQMMEQATGEPLNPAYFIAHLQQRYAK
ncbi:MAG: carboxypeptidase M32 [Devosiaceae bacterium]|nr:carboxypeptidase M32 [Devosiaceae bacterium]